MCLLSRYFYGNGYYWLQSRSGNCNFNKQKHVLFIQAISWQMFKLLLKFVAEENQTCSWRCILKKSYFSVLSDALTPGALLTLEGVPFLRELIPRESHSHANQWPWGHALSCRSSLSHPGPLSPAPAILRLSWTLDKPFPWVHHSHSNQPALNLLPLLCLSCGNCRKAFCLRPLVKTCIRCLVHAWSDAPSSWELWV